MAPYALQADLEQRFGVDAILISSDRNGTGEIDTSIVANALVDATAEIDTYLSERFDLPLSTVPTVLGRICCDISYYRMSSDIGTLTDEKRKRYEDAIKWLEGVASGKLGLGLSTDDTVSVDLPESGSGDLVTSSGVSERLFTRSSMGRLR